MFEGIYPPIPTPFDAEGALALDRLAANIEKWNATGLAGYVALGSNGEAPHVGPDEVARLIAATRRAALPSMKVIAGTGQLSTRATIEATQRAADAGADAALVVTPFYYKGGMTADALKRHYFAVADASPMPVLVYNVPANTGFNLPLAVVPELAAHDNIAGIKDSAGDINQLAEIVRLTRGMNFEVISGNYGALLPATTFGVKSAILAVANVAPKECVALLEAAHAGRRDEYPERTRRNACTPGARQASRLRSGHEAGDRHLRLLPVARAVTSQFGVPGLKAALDLLGYFGGSPRPPLLPVSESVREAIAGILRESELL